MSEPTDSPDFWETSIDGSPLLPGTNPEIRDKEYCNQAALPVDGRFGLKRKLVVAATSKALPVAPTDGQRDPFINFICSYQQCVADQRRSKLVP
jgi:hypothetical protein